MNTNAYEQDLEIFNAMKPGTLWRFDLPPGHPCKDPLYYLILEENEKNKFKHTIRLTPSDGYIPTQQKYFTNPDIISIENVIVSGSRFKPATQEEIDYIFPLIRKGVAKQIDNLSKELQQWQDYSKQLPGASNLIDLK